MYRDPVSGVWKLRCWREGKARTAAESFHTLAAVRAAIAYRKTVALSNIERAVWYRRLWAEAGLIRPLAVALPPLPSDATKPTRQAIRGFAILTGLRWLTYYGQPVPYTLDFAAAWSSVSKREARIAVNQALESGTIRQVDELVAGARHTRLFLPGAHPDATRRTDG